MIAFGTAELLLVVVSEWSVLRSLFVVPRANKFKKLLDLAGGDTKLANELIALAGGNTEVALRVTKLVGSSKMKELLPYIDDLASFEKSLQLVGNDVAVLNRLLIHTQSATKLQRILKSVPEAGKLSDEALEGVLKMSDDELRALQGKNVDEIEDVVKKVSGGGAKNFANQLNDTITRLSGNAKFHLNGTGKYKTVGGHHPVSKKSFEGDGAYDYGEAFSVKTSELDKVSGIINLHPKITGQQNSLYSAWKRANPNAKITINEMAVIEIQAMKNVGIPDDVATGWVLKALEDLRAQGVKEIRNIPWNGTN